MYIGFDPGLSTPTAVSLTAEGVLAGIHRFKADKLPKEATALQHAERVASISQQLLDLVYRVKPRVWAIEGYAHAERFHAHQLGELGGVIRYRALGYFKKGLMPFPQIVAPTSLKKFATGKGNANKTAVAVAASRLWDWSFDDEHSCDAAILAQIARATDGAYPSLLAYQAQAVSAIRKST